MLRFCEKEFVNLGDMETAIAEERVRMDKDIWQNCRQYFRKQFGDDAAVMGLMPITDGNGEILCYGWQDGEANRELRMIKELAQDSKALQFSDIFPQIREVIVYGCNELAYFFVKYLENLQIKVLVAGKYWELIGYQDVVTDETSGGDTMVIHAEQPYQNTGLYQRAVRGVSSEFECVDRIYEANVLDGRISDVGGGFEWFLTKLSGRTVAIMGTGAKAQDIYDLLYQYGVDITVFVGQGRNKIENENDRTLLGKRVVGIGYAVSHMKEAVFIGCEGKNSALGTEQTEIFDYYGYGRNTQFFLIDDYADVPYSNLVHVLKGKKVLLAGEVALCKILKEYLEKVEDRDINVRNIELGRYHVGDDEILCIVHPWHGSPDERWNPRLHRLREKMGETGHISYTEYFSRIWTFAMIDEHLNRDTRKYAVKKLIPKGILLGAIPEASGNYLVRGIMDGHPDILMMPYSDLSINLFLYCICLAREKATEILCVFEEMLAEGEYDKNLIADQDGFRKSMEELLMMKQRFTAQELFVIIHVAYAEMVSGIKVTDICNKMIYWEPHYIDRRDFPFLAKWLESPGINGYSLVMRRDGITGSGSRNKLNEGRSNVDAFVHTLSVDHLLSDTVSDRVSCRYWKEIRMRFEDLKLHPRKELSRICSAVGIPMADTMFYTTMGGKEWDYNGVRNFDLKPVFNKYEEYFSEFDRFRISVLTSPYQKKYGYVYEDCMAFSRKELWEMFQKEFRFQRELQFADERERIHYFLSLYEVLKRQLWNVRKHMLLDDLTSEFDPVEIGMNGE